jgi:GntR family transcriptional regulator
VSPSGQGPRRLARGAGTPLWRQLHDDLLRRLEAGEFAAGFPGELELRADYAVSRHTVREALRPLREAGLVDSHRGRPTRVGATIEQPLGSLYSLFREVEARGLEQTSRVLALDRRRDPDAADRLGLPADTDLVHLERVRCAGGEPLAHDRAWLPATLAAPLLDVDFGHDALYDALARTAGTRPTGGSERITAVVASAEEAALLGIEPGAACLSVERLGRVGDEPPIEYRQTVVRADRYALVTQWSSRGWQVGADEVGTTGPGSR